MSIRTEALARRIESGANALADLAEGLSEAEWRTIIPDEGRTVGILVHHVAVSYPLEIGAARAIAAGQPIAGLTWDVVAHMNAQHAQENHAVDRSTAIQLLRQNGRQAANDVRAFTDDDLDSAAAVSLNSDAPLTTQFVIEDHALRHSYHHMAAIRAVLDRQNAGAIAP
jgi:hypothetical protein